MTTVRRRVRRKGRGELFAVTSVDLDYLNISLIMPQVRRTLLTLCTREETEE